MAALAMDIRHDSSMDMLDSAGFLSACYHATCLKPGCGWFLAAPVCSSFVYVLLGLESYVAWMGNSR